MPQCENIRRMFDGLAPGYDAFNHIASLGIDRCWRRIALREVDGPRVLDEACGTGDFALATARKARREIRHARPDRASPPWSIIGVDISERMLEVMRRKVDSAGFAHEAGSDRPAVTVTAGTGDCCDLRFPDDSFDSVTVAFGMRNFEDREKALSEVLRVLRPGGRFVMLELGVPRARLVRFAYKLYLNGIMPLIGRCLTGDRAAYEYLSASVMAFPEPEKWLQTLLSAGFVTARHRSLSLGICNLFVATAPDRSRSLPMDGSEGFGV